MRREEIEGVSLAKLKRIPVEGGDILHGIKEDDPGFRRFGEAYFSLIHAGSIKAWKKHREHRLSLIVPVGHVRFVFVADDHQRFCEYLIGETNYCRLTVMPNIWFGMRGEAEGTSLITSISDFQHDLHEVDRLDINSIKFDWERL
jgi:dTDP-4-dehydrorhamnose 3,5-epimerase